MCGIVGYIGYRSAQQVVLDSLKRLEYRGYDSCGIAMLSGGEVIEVFKDVGRVESLEKSIPSCEGGVGIGHTRWATHGEVTQSNAHPHLDCTGSIAVVHNGVIDNFNKLRAKLTRRGHKFTSDTDTEVIPHLIEEYYKGSLEDAVVRALKDVSGSFAIVVLHKDSQMLLAARKESPLVIGCGDKESLVASDATAILNYTDRVIYPEDGDIVVLSEKHIEITNNGKKVARPVQKVPWSVEQIQKAGYEHFMLKEIHEQPRAIEATFKEYVSALEARVELGIEKNAGLRDILLLACGTSYHAALVGEQLFGKLCRLPARAKIASEFNPGDMVLDRTWAIGVTQSGETADVLKSLRKAKELGCETLAITNVPGSSVTRIADQIFYIKAGIEISVAATKSFLAQLTALYLMALAWSVLDTRTRQNLIEELKLLPARVQRVLDREEEIAKHAQGISRHENMFFIGRGLNYPVALEGALKMKEISYIHAEAHPAGELKHGPFALLRPSTPVVAIAARDDTYETMLTSIKEIKARGSPLLAIAQEGDRDIEQFADDVLFIPETSPIFTPFLNSVVLQLLAYYAAKKRGCPIDLPANLAKSVTVP